MPRIATRPLDLYRQMNITAGAIASEPGWTGPPDAEVSAKATEIEELYFEVRQMAQALDIKRTELARSTDEGRQLLIRVDNLLTALYGKGAQQKNRFALKPEDVKPSRPPAPEVPENLTLADAEGGLKATWDRMKLARFEIQWSADETFTTLLGTAISSRKKFLISGIEAGTRVYVRVRATRGGRTGDWTEPVWRYSNG